MSKSVPCVLLACLFFFVTACKNDQLTPDPMLSSAVQLGAYSNATLKKLTSTSDSLIYKPGDFDLTVYKLTYRTTLEDGTPTVASGVVFVPNQPSVHKPYPLLSYQHPTAFSDADIPSGGNFATVGFSYPLYFATYGYIVACPDYIGYGLTNQLAHRYEHRQTLAQATVDLLLATGEFLNSKTIAWNKQTFITGYSEGGYATLSTQKLIEEKYADKINLAASSCGDGPYSMSAFFNFITHQPTAGGISNQIYAWQTLSYDHIYKLNRPISYYFKAPYATQISQSLDNARKLDVSFDQICTPEFKDEVQQATSGFGKALNDNDLSSWVPKTSTQLIHSYQDEIIPFFNSQEVYNFMTNRGNHNVQLITLKSGYHIPVEVISLRRSLDWFQQLRS